MIKITLKNGKEYEVLDSTLVYPSGMSSVRNKMEIHLDESSMTLTELEKIFTDEKATDEIRVTKTREDETVEYDNMYYHYCIASSIGKKIISSVSNSTGEVTEKMCLSVVLEQRTYIEQKLYELGVSWVRPTERMTNHV